MQSSQELAVSSVGLVPEEAYLFFPRGTNMHIMNHHRLNPQSLFREGN